jgi:hypothetical protein
MASALHALSNTSTMVEISAHLMTILKAGIALKVNVSVLMAGAIALFLYSTLIVSAFSNLSHTNNALVALAYKTHSIPKLQYSELNPLVFWIVSRRMLGVKQGLR